MELFLIDAIGPFFRGYEKKRVNWSKIPFSHLLAAAEPDWEEMESELRKFAAGITAQGYNAVTLDDVAHLTHDPLHESEVTETIDHLRPRFRRFVRLLRDDFGLMVYLTSDVIPTTPAVEAAFAGNQQALTTWFRDLLIRAMDDFPELSGIILRIGESDGHDVQNLIRTRLHLRSAAETNRFLKHILPDFEARGKNLILRTWTVGAHRIGDLMWHRNTLARALAGIHSDRLIISMKHGESDFFRYLPLNESFSRIRQRKIIEFQARREYEGAGEYPSFIGWECADFAKELRDIPGMAGVSVWCQTGGWHRFRRRAFIDPPEKDIWIRFNTQAVISIFRHGESPEQAIAKIAGASRAKAAAELLSEADEVIRRLLYIGHFARQKWFFRRVRIPPLFHVYWDRIFINHGVRKLVRHFVSDPEETLAEGEEAYLRSERMPRLAQEAGLPLDDIEHMRDFLHLVLLARRYYFLEYSPELAEAITAAKKGYKARWPKSRRSRYRINTSFAPFPVRRGMISLAARVLLRRQRGYRVIDRVFTLYLAGLAYRVLRPRDPQKMPKFLRKSAMGVDAVLR